MSNEAELFSVYVIYTPSVLCYTEKNSEERKGETMKACRGLNIAGFVLGVVGAVTSVTGLTFSVISFLRRKHS